MKAQAPTVTTPLEKVLERETSQAEEAARRGICRGVVASAEGDAVLVDVSASPARSLPCDVIDSGFDLPLAVGDPVIVLLPQPHEERGCILGKVRPAAELRTPAQVVTVQAQRELTLRVGDASVTLRADGRVLIKGDAITSTARKLNRIRGGAVSLN